MMKLLLQTLLLLFFVTPTEALANNDDLFGCRAPQSSRVKDIFTTKASITWDAVSSANGYKIRLRKEGAPTWEVVLNTGFTHGFTFSELDSCTTYEYVIKANCPDGESGYSEIFTFTTGGDCFVTDTKVVEHIIQRLKVFPNPAYNQFSVKLDASTQIRGVLRVLNSEGQKIMERNISSDKAIQFNTDHLAPGIYWCQFYPENGSGHISERLIIQR